MGGRAAILTLIVVTAVAAGCSSSPASQAASTTTGLTAPPSPAALPASPSTQPPATSTTTTTATTTTSTTSTTTTTEVVFPDDLGEPADVELPVPHDGLAGDTHTYLTEDAQVVVDFVAALEPLTRNPDACADTTSRLDELASPDAIRDAVSGIPDTDTAEIIGGLWMSATRAIAVCNTATLEGDLHVELAWHWQLTRRALTSIGITS